MSNVYYTTDGVIGVNPFVTDTTAQFKLGQLAHGSDGSHWVYVEAGGAITQYDYLCVDEEFTALTGTKTNVDAGHLICFAQVAFASGEFGWVLKSGQGANYKVRVRANYVADATLYTTASGGVLDDASTSQTQIRGVVAYQGGTAATGRPIIATYPLGK